MSRNNFFKKTLVFTIITLFFCVSITPCISAVTNNIYERRKICEQTSDIVLNSLISDDTASLTFYTFDKTGRKQNNIDLPSDVAVEIKDLFDELKYKIVYDSKSIETQELKNSFINLIYENGLLSEKQSKVDVFSLLNPGWLKLASDNNLKTRNPSNNNFIRSFFSSYFGKSVFCSVSSAGSGMLMPLFMLPRPRAVAIWVSSPSYYGGITSVANMFTGRGFLAGGMQRGLLLGFMGIGLTYAVPGYTVYGFIGYSLFAGVNAEYMEFLPPNNAPIISNENPLDNAVDVPTDLDELSFRIQDSDLDLMDYTITTDPDVGSGSGKNKLDGTYKLQVSGLEPNSHYEWTISVTDGKAIVEKKFSFTTELLPFDPFIEGWHYRKKITINHSQVAGNLVDFPVLVSVTDSDLRDHAQSDGDDILFMDGSGVANKLYHEIEKFDSSNGEITSWINIKSLNSNVDTIIYAYYGNSDCINQENAVGTWDSNYIHVWHLGEDLTDSKGSSNGNNHGSSISTGKIGDARDLERDDGDYIDFGDMAQPGDGLLSSITFEAWIKPESLPCEIADKYDADRDKCSYEIVVNIDGKLIMYAYPWYGRYTGNYTAPGTITAGNWYYISGLYDLAGSHNKVDLFLNGFEISSSLDSNGEVDYMINVDITDDLGRKKAALHYGDGIFDEVRWSKILRSKEWIETTYNTINDPSSFFELGPEESPP